MGSLSPEDEALLKRVKDDLRQIRPRLWIIGQEFNRLQSKWVIGLWTVEEAAVPSQERW